MPSVVVPVALRAEGDPQILGEHMNCAKADIGHSCVQREACPLAAVPSCRHTLAVSTEASG